MNIFLNCLSVSVTLGDGNSIIISWTIVECIEQNGPITHYVVQYSSRNGSLQTAEITGDNYAITGLNPATKYTIQVAAGNVNGIGPFNEPAITIVTKGLHGRHYLSIFTCIHLLT